MINKKEVFEVKYVDAMSDKVKVVATLTLCEEEKYKVELGENSYSAAKFTIEEIKHLAEGLMEVYQEKTGYKKPKSFGSKAASTRTASIDL